MIAVNHYRRLPSIIVLVAFATLSLTYARPWRPRGGSGNGDLANATLDQLERRIAQGITTPQTWSEYGRRLFDAGQFARAAQAYEMVIEAEPYQRPARLQCAVSFASAGDADHLFSFLRSQLHVEPKLVAELFDRAELQRYLSEPRFATLRNEARAQAMD